LGLVFAKNVRPRTNLNVYFNDSQEKVIEYVFLNIVFYIYLMTQKRVHVFFSHIFASAWLSKWMILEPFWISFRSDVWVTLVRDVYLIFLQLLGHAIACHLVSDSINYGV